MKHKLHSKNLIKDVLAMEKQLKMSTKEEIDKPGKSTLRTPLSEAVVRVRVEAVKLLIKYGANVNATDGNGQNSLFYLGSPHFEERTNITDRLKIAALLLENGADVQICENRRNNQALYSVVYNVRGNSDELPLVKLLLKYGANPLHANKLGVTPLGFARRVGYQPLINILEDAAIGLGYSLDTDVPDNGGEDTKEVTYQDFDGYEGVSMLNFEQTQDLCKSFRWTAGAFIYIELHQTSVFQIESVDGERFLLQITNDSDTLVFHQKYASMPETIDLIEYLYKNGDMTGVTGFYEVPVASKTLDQVMKERRSLDEC